MPKNNTQKSGSGNGSRINNESRGRVEGEGSYTATRGYNKNLAQALKDKESVQRGAEKARKALEGPEGKELREAEKRGKAGPRSPKAARAR